MRKTLSVFLIALTAASLLSACGFRLRGNVSLPTGLERIVINAPASGQELATQLRQTLTEAGIQASTDGAADGQSWRIDILEERLERRAISITRYVETAEHSLELSARWQLRNPAGTVVIDDNTVRTRNIYRYDIDNPSGKDREERLLLRDMRDYLARQILTRVERGAQASPETVNSPAEASVAP